MWDNSQMTAAPSCSFFPIIPQTSKMEDNEGKDTDGSNREAEGIICHFGEVTSDDSTSRALGQSLFYELKPAADDAAPFAATSLMRIESCGCILCAPSPTLASSHQCQRQGMARRASLGKPNKAASGH